METRKEGEDEDGTGLLAMPHLKYLGTPFLGFFIFYFFRVSIEFLGILWGFVQLLGF